MKRKILAFLLGLSGAAMASGAEPVTVAWRDKPPYYYTENGVAKGFLLDRARQIFASAGIPARFVNEPQKRIWTNLKYGVSNYCSISWYRIPEREAIAQYSLPIHTDQPQGVLVHPSALDRVRSHDNLKALLADPTLTLGMVDGVSYGMELDGMIASSANHIMRRTVETSAMLRMLAVGRASYIFVDREDWNYLRNKENSLQSLVLLDYPDMPPGLKRHVVCSRDVPPETMDRLNRAIAARAGK
jgi:uncharacterized protein (TIGR02285 family)